MAFLFSRLIRNIVIAYIAFAAIQYLLVWKSYSVSPKEFRTIADKAKGTGVASASNVLVSDLRRTYGASIVPETQWIPVHPGGLSLRVQLLHASLTEYIAVFSAPFRTTGTFGLAWTNSTCTVLAGAVARSANTANLANKEKLAVGGNFRHGQFESYVYDFGEDTLVACYGRGVVPVSGLPLILGDLSTGEAISAARLLFHYTQAVLHNIALSAQQTFNYYKGKVTKSEL